MKAVDAFLSQVFFATVGANGSISYVITTAPALFAFSALQISVHLALTLVKTLLFWAVEAATSTNAVASGKQPESKQDVS